MGFTTLGNSQWDCKTDITRKLKVKNFYDILVNDSKLCKIQGPIAILSVKNDKMFLIFISSGNLYFDSRCIGQLEGNDSYII